LRAIRTTVLILSLSLFFVPVLEAKTAKKTAAFKAKVTKASTSSKTSKSHKRVAVKLKKSKKGAWKKRGQQAIDDARTREIQTALIREGYLSGEPTGEMDAETKEALKKLQQENNWQTKVIPDSRALIKLGLGPSHENLLNPETAIVSTPAVGDAARH
jgi:peptidoglycan hydrolase-like protein with peptidoglycan-binding domain